MPNNPTQFMQQYQSIKVVHGAKITAVSDVSVEFKCNGIEMEVVLGKDWIAKHTPHVGGYLVIYKDGYQSFSPAPQFEEGNLPIV